jgi:general secretion pathway protein K
MKEQVLRCAPFGFAQGRQDDKCCAHSHKRPGFALMAALWLVVLVGVTGYELSIHSRTRRLAVANSLEEVQAAGAADGALETVRASLEYRLAYPLDARDPWGNLRFVNGDTIRMGDERAVARAFDAGARLQINRATEDDVRRLLFGLDIDAGQADRLAQRIMDWRDRDTFRRGRGAERADYLRAGARTLPGDRNFTRVAELRDVDGMTPETYALVAPHITVLGTGQININSASRPVLASLPGLGSEAIALILRAQENDRPLRSFEELTQRMSSGARQAIVEAAPELMQRVTFETREVVVESEGWLDGSPVRTNAEVLYARGGDALFSVWRRVGL